MGWEGPSWVEGEEGTMGIIVHSSSTSIFSAPNK
jgi:hypothetical protein